MEPSKHSISRKLLYPFKGDKVIWLIFILLAIVSLISVYSSIGSTAKVSAEQAFFRHLLFVLGTFVVVILLSNFNYRWFATASWFGYLLSIVLLIAVLIIGQKNNTAGSGMSRWLNIPLLGRFQPSELAKIVIVIYTARLLAKERENLRDWKIFRKIVLALIIVAGLILSDNLSTALIIFVVCYIMIRLAPIDLRHWWLTLLGLVAFGALCLFIASKIDSDFLARRETWANRIDDWLNYNPDQTSQESMARMAVATGKFFGVGVGSTIQARLMTQANNDLIYAIIIEETGMLGGIFVFLLYALLYLRCIRIGWKCKGAFGRLTVVGLGTLIFLQAAIHMSVSVGALPVTGQTLPFISSGGSAYLCMGLGLGVIQSVAYDVKLREAKEKGDPDKRHTQSSTYERTTPNE